MRSVNSNGCIEVIDDYTTTKEILKQKPQKNVESVKIDDLVFKPSELFDIEDYLFFFDVVIYSIKNKNFDTVIDALDVSYQLFLNNPEPARSVIRTQFHSVFLAVIQADGRTKINYHIIIKAIEVADKILEDSHNSLLDRRDLELFKIIYLLKTFKSHSEIFPCGCIQNFIYNINSKNDKSISKSLIVLQKFITDRQNGNFQKSSVVEKYSYLFPIKYEALDSFEFYVEMLRELINCKIIEKSSDEICKMRLPYIISILYNLPLTDFTSGCRHLVKLIKILNCEKPQQIPGVLITAYKQYLYPAVFRFLKSFEHNEENKKFDEENAKFWIQKIKYIEDFPQHVENFFLPAVLMKVLLKTQNVEESLKKYLEDYIRTLEITCPHIQSVVIYLFIIFVNLKDPSTLLHQFLNLIVSNYKLVRENPTRKMKNVVFFVLDMLDGVSEINGTIKAIVQEKNVRSQLLLGVKLSSKDTIKYISNFKSTDLQKFLEFNIPTSDRLDHSQWVELVEKLEDMKIYVNYNPIWDYCLQNEDENEEISRFIVRQLEKIGPNLERRRRISQIMAVLKAENKAAKMPDKCLLLEFLDTVLGMDQHILAPNFTNEVIPLGIVAYCCFYEEEEKKVMEILNKLMRKIEENMVLKNMEVGSALKNETDDPFEIFARIFEISKLTFNKSGGGCDLKIWAKLKSVTSSGETFVKMLKAIVEMDKNESLEKVKKRIILIFSKMYQALVLELRQMGDKGASSFCMIAMTIEKYLVQHLKMTPRKGELVEMAAQMCDALAKCEKDWNILFVAARIMAILMAVNEEEDIVEELGQIVGRNEMLKERMKKMPDYKKIEKSLNW